MSIVYQKEFSAGIVLRVEVCKHKQHPGIFGASAGCCIGFASNPPCGWPKIEVAGCISWLWQELARPCPTNYAAASAWQLPLLHCGNTSLAPHFCNSLLRSDFWGKLKFATVIYSTKVSVTILHFGKWKVCYTVENQTHPVLYEIPQWCEFD